MNADDYTALAREPKLLLSIVEAAHLLGVCERTCRSLAAEGTLQTVKIGRRTLVRRADVLRIAAGGSNGSR